MRCFAVRLVRRMRGKYAAGTHTTTHVCMERVTHDLVNPPGALFLLPLPMRALRGTVHWICEMAMTIFLGYVRGPAGKSAQVSELISLYSKGMMVQ